MIKKNIIIHVKDNENIDNFINFIKNGYNEEIKYSKEVKFMIEEFLSNEWNVYLFSLDNFKNNMWTNVYDINNDKKIDLSIKDLNEKINVIIIRVIGSVEGNFNNVKNYLSYLKENFQGLVLNNPKAMLKGMTKNYLIEIDHDYLSNIGVKTIPTKIYSNTITFDKIRQDINDLSNYLIKPLSGELSNSLANLEEVTEKFLRHKETKVAGWVIQPIIKDIWNGEYQISFLNKNPIFAQKKTYKNTFNNSIPNQKERILEKYYPSEKEINTMRKLIEYMEELYKIKLDICRIDFMKDNQNTPILLEFEMVNPGFFIGYMNEYDNDIRNITNSIRKYCEECIK